MMANGRFAPGWRGAVLATVVAVAAVFVGGAAPVAGPASSPMVKTALDYLRGLATVDGRFEQTDARDAVSTGRFFLQRVGRARFDYDPPAQLSIISDGHKVFVINGRLKTLQSYPLAMTPFGLFLAREIRLDQGARVTSVGNRPGGFSITAVARRSPTRGSITLDFNRSPVALTGWSIGGGGGRPVRVRLLSLAPATPRDDSWFDARRRAAELGAH